LPLPPAGAVAAAAAAFPDMLLMIDLIDEIVNALF
jgi:hypothetical protein